MLCKPNNKWFDSALLVLFLSALFFTCLGGRPLASPDEGRYAEIPREMVESGEYITPHLNGLKYFEKPPFVYWLESLPLKMGFSSEFSLRFPIALFALLGCLAVYGYASRVYSRTTGYLSAITLGTSVLYFSLARLILLDLVLTVFMSFGLFAFIRGIKSIGGERRIQLALASASFACAVLTKGLIGLILPLAIIGIWVISLNKWKDLRPLYLPTNLIIFCAIALPWHILVSLKNPEFFDFYFIREHFERYFTVIHRRMQPWWFFIPITVVGFLPWIFFLPRALKNFIPFKFKDWKVYDLEAFLLIWVGFIFVFFSFSSSKLIPYILPIFPPLAIIIGRFLTYIIEGNRSTKIEAACYFLATAVLAISTPLLAEKYSDTQLYHSLTPYFFYIRFYLIGGSLLFLVLSFLPNPRWKIWGLIGFHIAFLFTLNAAGPLLQKTSMKPFASYIKRNLPPESEIIVYAIYPQDLPFYLSKTVKILNWSGELDSGREFNPDNKIFLTPETFKNIWSSSTPACVITTRSRIPEISSNQSSKPEILYQQDDYVLICKKPMVPL